MRFIAALFCMLIGLAHAQPIIIDGLFDDWPDEYAYTTDPAGDATGELDVIELGGVVRGNVLYLRIHTTTPLNFVAGAEPNPDLSVVLHHDGAPILELRARGRQLLRRDSGQVLTWDSVNYASAPTFASDAYEFRIDLTSSGGIGPAGVTIWLEGSDTLAAPLIVPAGKPDSGIDPDSLNATPKATSAAATPQATPTDLARMRDVRIASINTYLTGFLDNTRRPIFGRLLRSTEAEIILVQEEYNSNSSQVAQFFNEQLPLPSGATWNIHKRGDNVIASRYPILALPNHDPRYAAAAAITPNGPMVLLCVHTKCCGYIGSSEDQQRIAQTELMVQLIDEVRAGQHNTDVDLSDAPIIIGGDWNLVGSRIPLDMLTEPQLDRMIDLPLRRASGDASTWRALNGLGFPPGRLDLIAYDHTLLAPTFSEIFDTALLSPARLAQLGLQATDSRASDHLMLIADFRFRSQD